MEIDCHYRNFERELVVVNTVVDFVLGNLDLMCSFSLETNIGNIKEKNSNKVKVLISFLTKYKRKTNNQV